MTQSSHLDAGPVAYRSRGQSRAITALGLIAIVAAIIGPIGPIGTWGSDRFGTMVIIAVFGVLIGAFLVLRMGRAAVYAERDGVRIVNVWSTRFFTWGEIREFAKRPYGPAKVTTVDHRTVDIFAIQQSNWANMRHKSNTASDAMVAELNARLGAARDAQRPSVGLADGLQRRGPRSARG